MDIHSTSRFFLLEKTAGRFEILGDLKSKSDERISAGVGENRRGYYYIRKAWGWPDGTQSSALQGGNIICLLFFV
jgi:hypothetical protein